MENLFVLNLDRPASAKKELYSRAQMEEHLAPNEIIIATTNGLVCAKFWASVLAKYAERERGGERERESVSVCKCERE